MRKLWNIYHHEIPEFIKEFSATPPMQRLKDVGMNCGCEYTSFHYFTMREPYSRYDHSVGVALIVWHFTGNIAQSIAGLLHDISTPVFAHVIDFLNEDYITQESTEGDTKKIIEDSYEIQSLLKKYHLSTNDVCDYHMYPIADNDSPQLSADRLEYTLGNLYNYSFCELEEIQSFYNDLIVDKNEDNIDEIVFKSLSIAYQFTKKAFLTFEIYVADEDRFSMQALADIIKFANENKIITKKDLYKEEKEVIEILAHDPLTKKLWQQFCGYKTLEISSEKPRSGYWLKVNAKKRYIDAYVQKQGRIAYVLQEIKQMRDDFINKEFNYWISGK